MTNLGGFRAPRPGAAPLRDFPADRPVGPRPGADAGLGRIWEAALARMLAERDASAGEEPRRTGAPEGEER